MILKVQDGAEEKAPLREEAISSSTMQCNLPGLLVCLGSSLVAQTVKNLPAVQETQVQSQGQEDSLEKGMATHSSTLAWRTPWARGAWQATAHRLAKNWTLLGD